MPTPATGELRRLADCFEARIRIKGKERKGFRLHKSLNEQEALERCATLAQIAVRLRGAPDVDDAEVIRVLEMGAGARPGRSWDSVLAGVDTLCAGKASKSDIIVPTVKEFAKSWTTGELHKKHPDHVASKSTSGRDALMVRVYIEPHVGHLRLDEFTLEDAELVMANLPEISPRTGRPLAPASRRHVAQVMARLMNLAVYPGRWRKESPIPRGWLPRIGSGKAKECLYPDEDALLLAGKSVEEGKRDVPLLRSVAYGFLSREGMRADEMASLKWGDVDLERGHVHLDTNKTDDPRDWDLRPDVVRGLQAWKERYCPGAKATDHVFAEGGVPISTEHLADQLRADLARVGVTRPQLFERSAARQPIRAHDLRATFITISLATGKTETFVMDRTGHTTSLMVNRYRRKARSWNLGELGPLDLCIPELGVSAPASAPEINRTGGETGRRSGFRFHRREA